MCFVYIGAFVFFQKSAATYLSFYFKSNENSAEKIHYLKLFQTLLFTEQRRRILFFFSFFNEVYCFMAWSTQKNRFVWNNPELCAPVKIVFEMLFLSSVYALPLP